MSIEYVVAYTSSCIYSVTIYLKQLNLVYSFQFECLYVEIILSCKYF